MSVAKDLLKHAGKGWASGDMTPEPKNPDWDMIEAAQDSLRDSWLEIGG